MSISVWSTFPFKKVPAKVIIELLAAIVFWFHAFPHHDSISTIMSTREIITGMTLDCNHHCKHQYGDYVSLRKIGAISLRPTGN